MPWNRCETYALAVAEGRLAGYPDSCWKCGESERVSIERKIQAVIDWTPRWAESERNWVLIFVVLSALSMLVAPMAIIMAWVLWVSLRTGVFGFDWYPYRKFDPTQPPHPERLRVFSPAGRGFAIALVLFAAGIVTVGLQLDAPFDRIYSVLYATLWLYIFYSHDLFQFFSALRSRGELATKRTPALAPELEAPYSARAERIVTGLKAFLLLNLGAYTGVAVLARAYGLSTGWPPDSETTVMAWKGVAIALALLSAAVLPFLVDFRREHREGQVYLLAIGTVALAIWL